MTTALLAAVAAGACSSRGSVTFQIDPPVVPVFNPLSSKRLSEYELQTADGALVGVASVSANDGEKALLPLGALQVTPKPEDVVMSLFSGSQLLGMARIRDVEIKREQQKTFDAFVRKPLVFVGSTLPAESAMFNAVTDGQILDFTSTTTDLAHPAMPDSHTPKLPDNISAAAVTSDGTMLLAGRKSLLTVYDTGTGTTQDLVLPFTPSRVVVAPRDAAAAALDPGDSSGGSVALFRDVATLRSNAATAMPTTVKLLGVQPRAAVFSGDATLLYVLGGGGADPCGPGTPPGGNTITQVGVADGSIKGTWNMPDFVSDVATDNVGVLVSRSVAGEVARITPGPDPSAAPTFQKVFDATCPTALHVTNGEVLAVTSLHDPMLNTFAIARDHLDNSPPTILPIGAPVFQTDDTGLMQPSPSPNQPVESITLTPVSLYAYDLAVTPDGGTAVFAARLRYTESNAPFTVLGAIDCTATLDIVEYGLYIVDTASGNATYQQRSQIVTNPESNNDPCMVCPLDALDELPFYCDSSPGDRAAGLAAIFGGP